MPEPLSRADVAVVNAAVEAGAYDAVLGITDEHRRLLNKCEEGAALTLDDVRELRRLNRHDLIDAAHRAGRITLTEGAHHP